MHMVKKFRMLVLMTLPLYAERPMKLFSTIDFATQIGQQQLTIVMLYQSKDRDQKRAFDNFKRAAKDAEIRKAVAFLYGDLDKYDFDLVLQRYKITQFPTYMLFRTTYDEKTKESEDTLVATTVGRPLNLNGIINFIMQHF